MVVAAVAATAAAAAAARSASFRFLFVKVENAGEIYCDEVGVLNSLVGYVMRVPVD